MAEVLASARRMYCNSDITSDPTACLEDFIPIAKVGSALCAVLCSCDVRAIVAVPTCTTFLRHPAASMKLPLRG
jgi:hypothetical protein